MIRLLEYTPPDTGHYMAYWVFDGPHPEDEIGRIIKFETYAQGRWAYVRNNTHYGFCDSKEEAINHLRETHVIND